MRLLIITQVVDKNHPVLGFFHRWVEFFAKECQSIELVCLESGKFDLPDNVTVHSLGKEKGGGNKIKYLWRFFCLLWRLRRNYDDVFVHMNQIYVILAGPYWRFSGKTIGLWYAHGTKSLSLRIATRLAHHIFSSTRYGFPLHGSAIDKKLTITNQGIDADIFSPREARKDIDLLTIGRLSPSKNLELLLTVLKNLQTNRGVRLTIIGSAATDSDQEYVEKLKEQSDSLGITDLINWVGPVPNEALPGYLQRTKVFIHAGTTGSLDKTLLEPLFSGVPMVTSAEGARCLPLGDWQVASAEEMTQVVRELLQATPTDKITELREFVITNHSLQKLIPRICNTYKK